MNLAALGPPIDGEVTEGRPGMLGLGMESEEKLTLLWVSGLASESIRDEQMDVDGRLVIQGHLLVLF